jgi:AraC-like DNA-binding protein
LFKEYKYNFMFPSKYHPLLGLYPTWVGYLSACKNYECKPRVLDDYFIIFVSRGKGLFKCKGIEYSLARNDIFFLLPGVVHSYVTDPADLLELWWIGFNGSNAQRLVGDLDIAPNCCHIKGVNNAEVFFIIKEIVQSLSEGPTSGAPLKSAGSLYKLFGLLTDQHTPGLCPLYHKKLQFTEPVERALSFMDANYSYDISIKQIANYAGLSRTHFTMRFKDEVGCSPLEHLLKMRLKQAKYYLCNSSLAILEIAHSTGFQDPQYFSRFFRKYENMTPLEFRKLNSVKAQIDENASKTPI